MFCSVGGDDDHVARAVLKCIKYALGVTNFSIDTSETNLVESVPPIDTSETNLVESFSPIDYSDTKLVESVPPIDTSEAKIS
jgi:hypothetical protein